MSINQKDANDLALSVIGVTGAWLTDNAFQAIGTACTVATLVFVMRRYYRDGETARLEQEKLRLEIERLKGG